MNNSDIIGSMISIELISMKKDERVKNCKHVGRVKMANYVRGAQ